MEVNLNQAASKRNITIRFRVYDYGMGLRYEFPQQERDVYKRQSIFLATVLTESVPL